LLVATSPSLLLGAETQLDIHKLCLNVEAAPEKLTAEDRMRLEQVPADSLVRGRALAILACYYRTLGKTLNLRKALATVALDEEGRWNFKEPDACLEYARLVFKDDRRKAAQAFDHLAEDKRDDQLYRVLAAEAAGDCLLEAHQPATALQAYDFAEKVGRHEEYLRENPRAALALKRIAAAKAKARRLADIDKFGEDFLQYREAEKLRRQDKDCAKALPIYQEMVKRFPGTVFAEAAELYQSYCLAALDKVDEAEKGAAAFYQKNKFGLYRGEALLLLGRLAVERRLDPNAGEKWFAEMEKWLGEVEAHDATLPNFLIKDAAKPLTEPPASERRTDFWGNINPSQIEPGQLVNRRTCPWYLDDLREQCAIWQGFLLFYAGRHKEALKKWELILKYDSQAAQMQAQGIPNNYSRLKGAADDGYMLAYPQEMQNFQGPQRLAVLVGDLYYGTEKFEWAQQTYQRLLKSGYGKLSPDARDYAQLGYARAVGRERGRDAILRELPKVWKDNYRKTFTQRNAKHSYAGHSLYSHDRALIAQAAEIFKELAFDGTKDRISWMAWIDYGLALDKLGKPEGEKVLREIAGAGHPEFSDAAKYHLEIIEMWKSYRRQEEEKAKGKGRQKEGEKP
jgi:hypothetical protein